MRLRCRIPLAHFELDIDVSFESRITAIFGPSGSGKTTLLDAIAGLRPIAEGDIVVDGRTLYCSSRGVNLSPQRRGVGYVPQEGALFPHLSVRRNILFGARRESDKRSTYIDMQHVLDVLEIGHLLDRPVTKLSGGEAQRVALARAILSNPRLLLLDEPLAAVDIGLKERILPYLRRVRDEFAIPMIYVTHNLSEVLSLADWVIILRRGRLVAQGIPEEVLRSSAAQRNTAEDQLDTLLSVAYIGSDAHKRLSRVRLASGQELWIPCPSQPPDQRLHLLISADDVLIAKEAPRATAAENVLAGTIRSIGFTDGQAILTIFAGEEFYARLSAAFVAELSLAENSRVFLIMKAGAFRFA